MSRESYPNLIGELAVVKGETYRKLIENNSISFTGDLTTATLRGQIRNNYVDAGGQLLGTFSFEESVYDEETNKTFIKPYLTEFATLNLTTTSKYRQGAEPSVKTNLVYDIELFFNDEIIKHAPGFIQVIGEVTGGEISYNPSEEWGAGIYSIELLTTVGFIKTYVIWGDEEKTINLGTFDVVDTQPTEGVSGFGILAVEQGGDWDVEINNTVDVVSNTLATSNKQDELLAKLPDGLTINDGKLLVNTELTQPLTSTQLETLTIKVEEQNPLSFDGLASEYNQSVLNNKIPDGLTVVDNKLQVNANVTLPDTYDVIGTVSIDNFPDTQPVSFDSLPSGINIIGSIANTSFGAEQSGTWTVGLDNTSLTALENITAQIDTTGLATDTKQDTINTKLEAISNKIPTTFPVSGTVTVANSTFGAVQSGTWTVGITNTSFGISGTLPAFASTPTVNIGTIGSIATTTNQDTTNTRLSSILTALGSVTLASEAGYLTYRNTALTSTPQTIKSGAGNLMGFNIINVNTTTVYVKFYNTTSPIVGTTAPLHTVPVPPSDGVTPGIFYQEPNIIPLEFFSTAISVACVTGLPDSSTTAPTTPIHCSARYK